MDSQICTIHCVSMHLLKSFLIELIIMSAMRIPHYIRLNAKMKKNIEQTSSFNVEYDFYVFHSIRHITNGFILIYQLGICCIYVVFVASNIKSLMDYFTGSETDVRMYMLIILLPLILINWVSECN